MKVLVVHDRSDVKEQIVSVCKSIGHAGIIVHSEADGTSARRRLTAEQYDLLIIDLTLPHIGGRDEPSYLTVDGLLGELFLLDDMRTPGDIIGITREVGALAAVATSISSHVMTVLEEDPGGAWRRQLGDKLNYLVRASQARLTSLSLHYRVDLLVVTALDSELAPYHKALELTPDPSFPGSYSFGFSGPAGAMRRGIAFAVGRSGEARAATSVQSLLSVFRPRLVLMTGICGGVKGKTELGDLVFAESAIDWDYGKWEDPSDEAEPVALASPRAAVFRSRPDPVSIFDTPIHRKLREFLASQACRSPEFLDSLRATTEGKIREFRPHLAPMASGSAVIASDSVLSSVRDLNESIRGVDMECFGVYLASVKTHNARPQVLCIKAVADFCNGMKNDSYHSACANASALVAREFVKSLSF